MIESTWLQSSYEAPNYFVWFLNYIFLRAVSKQECPFSTKKYKYIHVQPCPLLQLNGISLGDHPGNTTDKAEHVIFLQPPMSVTLFTK